MFKDNRVVQHTGSRYPVFQAPMTWIARAPLVAAVSAAGGMGLLESSSRDLIVTKREFAAIRAATDAPFGVNLPIRFLQGDPREEEAILDWLVEQDIRFVTTSAGDPTRYISRFKDAGLTVYHATATLHGALKADDAGVDGLIVEGSESAGMRAATEVSTFALLQAVREAVTIPIVAAGGIVDGRGMAAAFALGAEGVAMGTRFLASSESPVHFNYKQAIIDAEVTDTMLLDSPPSAKWRGLRTSYALGVACGERERSPMGEMINRLYIEGDVDNCFGAAGQSAGLIHSIEPVAAIIEQTIASFGKTIADLAALSRDHAPVP